MNELLGLCKDTVKKRVREEAAYTDEAVKKIIFDVISREHRRHWIPLGERILIAKRIFYGLCGFDVLQPLLDDDTVTDVMVMGCAASALVNAQHANRIIMMTITL